MRNKIIIIISFFALLLISSCTKENKPTILSSMQEADTTCIRRSLLSEVRRYMRENSDAQCYLLKSTGMHREKPNRGLYEDVENEIFMIVTVDKGSIANVGEFRASSLYPGRYFMLDGKMVFLSSDADAIMDQNKLKKDYLDKVKEEGIGLNMRFLLVSYYSDSCVVVDDPFVDESIININPPKKNRVPFTAPTIK
jgi:uncharacterized protein YnzC (UPF0291/DUF896 family)